MQDGGLGASQLKLGCPRPNLVFKAFPFETSAPFATEGCAAAISNRFASLSAKIAFADSDDSWHSAVD
jgi:hypothetical protein